MSPYKRVMFIINPAAGGNEPILNTLNDTFKDSDLEWQVRVTHRTGDGARYAQEALAQGYDLVAAYGGDGTLLDVAEGMIDSDTPVAFLPGGTANALIDELGIPPSLAAAAQLIVDPQSQLRSMDIGMVEERPFLLRVGCGLIGTLSAAISREMKERFGVMAYVIGGITGLRQAETAHYRLEIDGRKVEADGIALLIANAAASGGGVGLRLARDVHPDDGLLDVFIVRPDPAWLIDLARLVADTPANLINHIETYRGREITITARPALGLYADGESEALVETPATITVKPSAIRILVPGSKEAEV